MASFTFDSLSLNHRVFQPKTVIPETHRSPPPPSVQIELTISLEVMLTRHDCAADMFNGSDPIFSEQSLRFDLDLLKNHDQAYQVLAPTLTGVGVDPASDSFDEVIDEIIEHGLKIGSNGTSNAGQHKVLALRSELRGSVIEHENEGRIMEEESAADETESNNGMVPAKKSSVKKMMKRVKVEGEDPGEKDVEERRKKRRVKGEDCVICMEEMNGMDGLSASQMPCSHTFHSKCIKKWLKQSHYCPICRFEMPT